MENLLFITNNYFSDGKSLEFACHLAHITGSRLQGILLKYTREERACMSEITGTALYGNTSGHTNGAIIKTGQEQYNAGVQHFSKFCEKEGISYVATCLRGDPLQEAFSESRSADLIVVGAKTSFEANYNQCPSSFVWALLQIAESPVVIAPEQLSETKEIAFIYDGSASSIFAFRRFAYLFPCFKNSRIVVVHADRFPQIEHKRFINDQLKEYYSQIEYEILYNTDFDSGLFDFYQRRKNCFFVMGASGRSHLSGLFRNSAYAGNRKVDHPVFISHF